MKYPKHPRKKWDTGERVEFKGGRRMQLPPHHHLNPPDRDGEEYIELEPNWHGMGRWALNGVASYVNSKGTLKRKSMSYGDRKSLLALLASACGAAYYVHDIGSELLSLLGDPRNEWTVEPSDMVATAEYHGKDVLANPDARYAFDELRTMLAFVAAEKYWGEASTGLSEAVNSGYK